jgi:hypothetical protein
VAPTPLYRAVMKIKARAGEDAFSVEFRDVPVEAEQRS